MSTIIKFILVALAVVVGALAIAAAAFLYSPGLQHKAAMFALKRQFGDNARLEHIRVGLGTAEVRGLEIVKGNETLALDALDARFDLWGLLNSRVAVESLAAKGHVLRARESHRLDFDARIAGLAPGATAKAGFSATLTSAAPADPFKSVGLAFDGDLSRSTATAVTLAGTLRLTGPQTVTTGTLAANVETADRALLRFDAKLDADALSADEWQPMLALLPQQQPQPERSRTPDTLAPWAGLDGVLAVTLARLQAGGQTLTGVAATVRVTGGRTVDASIAATTGKAPVKVDAQLAFDPAKPDLPYTLTANVDVRQFDVTPHLRAPGSRQPVILEGVFNAAGTFSSTAPNLAFIADGLTGGLRLESAGAGVFRPLGEKTTVATGVSGILGALSGSVRELAWVQQVLDQLKEIPYTRMGCIVERDASRNLVLRDLDLVSRDARIRGSGMVNFQQGVDLLSLPMDLQFQLFAKGRLADALRTGKQLGSDQPDDLGYLTGPPLPIRGSLAQPESMLANILVDSATRLLPGLLRR